MQWGRAKDAYKWVPPPENRSNGSNPRPQRVVKVKPPLLQETHDGSGGVQGFTAIKQLMMIDEDGDEAMEFFDVTDAGLKKRVPSGLLHEVE